MGYYIRKDRKGKFYAFDSLSDVLLASGELPWLLNAIAAKGYTRWDHRL